VDNLQDGPSGNPIAPVRPGDGVTTAPVGADRHGVMREVTPDPADALPAPGERLPGGETPSRSFAARRR
jgi:hypothetical protein